MFVSLPANLLLTLRAACQRAVTLAAVCALLACATPPAEVAPPQPTEASESSEASASTEPEAPVNLATSPWAIASNTPGQTAAWAHKPFPGKRKSHYVHTRMDERDAIEVNAVSSASLLIQKVRIAPQQLDHLQFSWKVPQLIKGADLAVSDTADSPVRIVLAFEGDRSRFSIKNAMLSEMSHLLTGEPMPYATLIYVWCNTRAPGTVITNPRTDRIRKLVVESGAKNLNQWLAYDRDIRADFEKAFGEPPGPLLGIGIMTDTDNTRTTARAWYGPVRLAGRQALASQVR